MIKSTQALSLQQVQKLWSKAGHPDLNKFAANSNKDIHVWIHWQHNMDFSASNCPCIKCNK
jgi:hypothetical protein